MLYIINILYYFLNTFIYYILFIYYIIFYRTLLCCDNENFTWNNVININRHFFNETTSLLYVVYRIIIPAIIISGIFGNILIFLVLSTPMFRGIAYLYLRGLTSAHIGVLLSWIPICMYHNRNIKKYVKYKKILN